MKCRPYVIDVHKDMEGIIDWFESPTAHIDGIAQRQSDVKSDMV